MRAGETPAVALAGNPNVGKSTLFNALTGMRQHTGNWSGKTVGLAQGLHRYQGRSYRLVDLPGTYALAARSAEEDVARAFIMSGEAAVTVVVCDATSLARGLILAVQVMALAGRVVVCVNLMDEAQKKGLSPDLDALSKLLGVPVVGTEARGGHGLEALMEAVARACDSPEGFAPLRVILPAWAEAIAMPVARALEESRPADDADSRWLALCLLAGDAGLDRFARPAAVSAALEAAARAMEADGLTRDALTDVMAEAAVAAAQGAAEAAYGWEASCTPGSCHACGRGCPSSGGPPLHRSCAATTNGSAKSRLSDPFARDRRLDKWLTGRWTGTLTMLALLAGVLWLTIVGSNYPSQALFKVLFAFQDILSSVFNSLGAPQWLHGALVLGGLPHNGLGCGCHVAAHGNIFSALYLAGGFWLPAPGGV